MKFRKKPVVIEAMVWKGDNLSQIAEFMGEKNLTHHKDGVYSANLFYTDEGGLIIKTLEGEHKASVEDYIIKGVKGEFYPCKPDIFEMTYDEEGGKTLYNTDSSGAKQNVKDIEFWGDGDTFKLISKASSKKEGWMKSTKAMEIAGAGCVIQVTTQQGDNVSEAVTFVPDVSVSEILDEEGKVTSRKIIRSVNPYVLGIPNGGTAYYGTTTTNTDLTNPSVTTTI